METGRLKSQKDGRLRYEYGKLMNLKKFKFILRQKNIILKEVCLN